MLKESVNKLKSKKSGGFDNLVYEHLMFGNTTVPTFNNTL